MLLSTQLDHELLYDVIQNCKKIQQPQAQAELQEFIAFFSANALATLRRSAGFAEDYDLQFESVAILLRSGRREEAREVLARISELYADRKTLTEDKWQALLTKYEGTSGSALNMTPVEPGTNAPSGSTNDISRR